MWRPILCSVGIGETRTIQLKAFGRNPHNLDPSSTPGLRWEVELIWRPVRSMCIADLTLLLRRMGCLCGEYRAIYQVGMQRGREELTRSISGRLRVLDIITYSLLYERLYEGMGRIKAPPLRRLNAILLHKQHQHSLCTLIE